MTLILRRNLKPRAEPVLKGTSVKVTRMTRAPMEPTVDEYETCAFGHLSNGRVFRMIRRHDPQNYGAWCMKLDANTAQVMVSRGDQSGLYECVLRCTGSLAYAAWSFR